MKCLKGKPETEETKEERKKSVGRQISETEKKDRTVEEG